MNNIALPLVLHKDLFYILSEIDIASYADDSTPYHIGKDTASFIREKV